MAKARTRYLSVAASDEVKTKVARMAARERRSVAEQSGLIFDIGLEEYERREKTRNMLLQHDSVSDQSGEDSARAGAQTHTKAGARS